MVNDLVKKLIVEWDTDFTKLTTKERENLEKSDFDMKNGNFVTEEDVWS